MSRIGDTEAAIELLQGILDKASKGWLRWLETDTDLDPIRDDPRFIAMVEKSRQRFNAPAN
jgi:adenylate cyclase